MAGEKTWQRHQQGDRGRRQNSPERDGCSLEESQWGSALQRFPEMTTIMPLMLYLSANFLQPRNLECLNKNILLPGMKDKRALGTCKFQCYKHSLYNGTILTAPIYEVKEIMIHETGRHPE